MEGTVSSFTKGKGKGKGKGKVANKLLHSITAMSKEKEKKKETFEYFYILQKGRDKIYPDPVFKQLVHIGIKVLTIL